MKSIFVIAALIGAAIFGGFTVAAPAQASCAPGFTSIPCTIVDNVVQAPQQIADGLAVAPGNLAGQGCAQPTDGSGYKSSCGLPGAALNLAGEGCPPGEDGSTTTTCGLPAVPGQLFTGIATLPVQAAIGANQIATAPQTIAGSLAKAPKQFFDAITHGGTDPDPDN
ncbi:hypothetical protein [Mycolicibacterium cosmeticum]|uniref:hypothetical protein n=1 Tax=Mycolicibacterium cosmeticum TaxID=258533 RepID=UPI00320487AC